MTRWRAVCGGLSGLIIAGTAQAHFLELIPAADILTEATGPSMTLDLTFTHPMERGPVMDLAPPTQFGVLAGGRKTDLKAALTARTVDGKQAWRATYRVKAPGDYVFYVEPQPYWEPTEKKHIIHYAKVVVDYGSSEGWDAAVGAPIEIIPLTRPYGLWTGALFRGVALKSGAPLAGAAVEIEWRNDGSITPPSDPFVTQVVKTDAAGQFAATLPRAGWWGFTVLSEADKLGTGPDGKPAPTEIGGAIWVKTVDMK